MKANDIDLIRLLKKVTKEDFNIEVLYYNQRLLDDLFENQFGGVTNLLKVIERTSEYVLKGEGGAGIGGVLTRFFLDIKAGIKAEGKIGKLSRNRVEEGLTLHRKISLCLASLEMNGLIAENPPSLLNTAGKYLSFSNGFSTYTLFDNANLEAVIGIDRAGVIFNRLKKDEYLAPGAPQVALVASAPFCMAAIVKVQSDLHGSTYIISPPPPERSRNILAGILEENQGVTFLKTYWIIDVG